MRQPKSRLWRDTGGVLDEVQIHGDTVLVIRGPQYVRPGSVSCQLQDSGNGYSVRFPAHGSVTQDKCFCLAYDEARDLVLALSPHRCALGFEETP